MFFVTPAYAEESTAHAAGADATSHVQSETGVAHDAGHEGKFPPFNPEYYGSQILWLVLSFVVFYLTISRVVAPRLGGILENRQDRIARDLDEASRMKSEADDAISAYEAELVAAKAKASTIGSEARDVAKAEAEEERTKAEAALSEKIAAAEKSIGEIKEKALSEVGAIASEAASGIVEKLTGNAATDAEIADAIAASQAK